MHRRKLQLGKSAPSGTMQESDVDVLITPSFEHEELVGTMPVLGLVSLDNQKHQDIEKNHMGSTEEADFFDNQTSSPLVAQFGQHAAFSESIQDAEGAAFTKVNLEVCEEYLQPLSLDSTDLENPSSESAKGEAGDFAAIPTHTKNTDNKEITDESIPSEKDPNSPANTANQGNDILEATALESGEPQAATQNSQYGRLSLQQSKDIRSESTWQARAIKAAIFIALLIVLYLLSLSCLPLLSLPRQQARQHLTQSNKSARHTSGSRKHHLPGREARECRLNTGAHRDLVLSLKQDLKALKAKEVLLEAQLHQAALCLLSGSGNRQS